MILSLHHLYIAQRILHFGINTYKLKNVDVFPFTEGQQYCFREYLESWY